MFQGLDARNLQEVERRSVVIMSWLYSLIFAGLIFSTDSAPAGGNNLNFDGEHTIATQDSGDVTEKFEQTYPLNANGRVSVSNVNGSINIESWERAEVRLEAEKIADSAESLATIHLEIESEPSRFKVGVEFDRQERADSEKRRKREVRFKLFVPRTATLDEIETVNGSVSVRDFSKRTKISAINGNISAVNLGGTVSLSTVNGGVTAEFSSVDPESRIDLETVNGTINAVIPSDVDAIVKADSLNGEIKNDFGLPVQKGRYVGRNLSGRIGSGAARIKLSSVNGGLTLGRKNDGKNVKPAVNLLKEGEDEAAISEPMRISRQAREEMKRGIETAVRESEIGTLAAREARIAMAELIPELARIPVEAIAKVEAELATEEFQAKIKEAVAAQTAVLARMRDVNWPKLPTTIKQRSNSFSAAPGSSVSVEAKGCDVRVIGWDRPEVKYVLMEESTGRDSKPVEIVERQEGAQLNLKFTNESGKPFDLDARESGSRVRVDIFVPGKTNLRLSSDGEIRVSRVSGTVELSASDQPVNLRDMEGRITLEAAGAMVRLVGFRGEFDSRTETGDVYLEGEFSGIISNSEKGNVILSVPENANFEIASNRDVESDGILLARGENNAYRIGRGGPVFRFDFGDGKLLLRKTYAREIY